MFDDTRDGYVALPTTVPTVLEDSLLHSFWPRDGHGNVHIQHYISESLQSCDASKRLFQGGKQQKFNARKIL
jgi:hypothetical protein